MRCCRQFRIHGAVQGVSFRYYTRKQAVALQLCGWVRNCNDGCVQVFLMGDLPHIEMMQQWLEKGPSLATVTLVQIEPCLACECHDFKIKY